MTNNAGKLEHSYPREFIGNQLPGHVFISSLALTLQDRAQAPQSEPTMPESKHIAAEFICRHRKICGGQGRNSFARKAGGRLCTGQFCRPALSTA